MTQKEKQLLLKDLCGRLPYGVKFPYHIDEDSNHRECDCVATMDTISEDMVEFTYDNNGIIRNWNCIIEEVKPYLRPMSSMTEKELKEFVGFTSLSMHRFICSATNTDHWYNTYEEEDWLNEHHFDYRRLIEKGLALEAPEGMYKTE